MDRAIVPIQNLVLVSFLNIWYGSFCTTHKFPTPPQGCSGCLGSSSPKAWHLFLYSIAPFSPAATMNHPMSSIQTYLPHIFEYCLPSLWNLLLFPTTSCSFIKIHSEQWVFPLGLPALHSMTPLLWHLNKCLWSKSMVSRTITLWGHGKKWIFLIFICIVTSVRPGAQLKLNKWLLNTILYVLFHLPSSAWFTFWQEAWKCPWQTWNPCPGEKEETSAASFWV